MKFAAITVSTHIKTITLIMNSTAIITIIAIVVIKANTPITKVQNLRLYLIRILIMCFVSVRAVYDLCQGE